MSQTFQLDRRRLLWLGAGTLAGLSGCGGGVEVGGTGSQPQVFANGPITGFGSIIVGGVHYDDSAVTARDEDGQAISGGLQLGMVVAIDGSQLDRSGAVPTATANTVTVSSEIIGPVSARDDVAGTLTVLGQTVRITPTPAADGVVAVGDVIEVYGLHDPANQRYTATRLQHRSDASVFKLHGKVSQLGPDSFQVGALVVSYTSAPAGLANGAVLRLKLSANPDGQGRYALRSGETEGTRRPGDGTEVEVEGVIASYGSNASFVVRGLTLDASAASIAPVGAVLAAGVTVEAEGTMRAGVMQVAKLQVKAGEDGGGGSDGETEVEITSPIASVDLLAKTLVLNKGGMVVDYAQAIFKDGFTEAGLVVGARIEVKGTLSADGTRLVAASIERGG